MSIKQINIHGYRSNHKPSTKAFVILHPAVLLILSILLNIVIDLYLKVEKMYSEVNSR